MSQSDSQQPEPVDTSGSAPCSLPPWFVSPVPHVGPVTVIRENVYDGFGDAKIYQHGGSFRVVGEGFKLTVSAEDALWIIDRLKLGASKPAPFRRSVVWSNE